MFAELVFQSSLVIDQAARQINRHHT